MVNAPLSANYTASLIATEYEGMDQNSPNAISKGGEYQIPPSYLVSLKRMHSQNLSKINYKI